MFTPKLVQNFHLGWLNLVDLKDRSTFTHVVHEYSVDSSRHCISSYDYIIQPEYNYMIHHVLFNHKMVS